MSDVQTAEQVEQAIRKYLACDTFNKLNAENGMHADASEADLLKLSTNDFIGVVSLRDLSHALRSFGFVVTYKSNGYDANLQISLNGPSVATGLDKMAADTELYTQRANATYPQKKTPDNTISGPTDTEILYEGNGMYSTRMNK